MGSTVREDDLYLPSWLQQRSRHRERLHGNFLSNEVSVAMSANRSVV